MSDKKTAPRRKSVLALATKNKYWRRMVSFFEILAEVSNIGILVEIIAKWIPRFAVLATSPFIIYLMAIADPLIYFFRALIRLTRIVGRNFFGITFVEEKNGTHKYQTLGDIVSLTFFTVAVLLFAFVATTTPIGLTLAWTFGLCGLIPIGYFDYTWPEQQAKEKYKLLLKDRNATPESREKALNEYLELRRAKLFFIALLIGLSLLLICGSAAAFAPPVLVPVLIITSKIASIYLGGIAIGRFLAWLFKSNPEETENTTAPTATTTAKKADASTSTSNTPQLTNLFKAEASATAAPAPFLSLKPQTSSPLTNNSFFTTTATTPHTASAPWSSLVLSPSL
jgi:hypothetical protein